MIILGIESSCDETAVALIEVKDNKVRVLVNAVNSQINIHTKFGGVVPEVAARQHILNIIPLLHKALSESNKEISDIDLISVTQGPGLIGALMVGLETAKTLAWISEIPLIPINHLSGHLWSFVLNPVKQVVDFNVKFPYLSLIVSGGHTELALVENFHNYHIIGKTLDDAVGEAFDKVAKILNLGYPGGPAISKAAINGKADRFSLPRPLINKNTYNFSFAGLKTAVLYQMNKIDKTNQQNIFDMAASFQAAAINTLLAKLEKAVLEYKINTISVTGGVSANQELRNRLQIKYKNSNIQINFPEFSFTGDNAAMIALAGYIKWQNSSDQEKENFKTTNYYLKLSAKPNLTI